MTRILLLLACLLAVVLVISLPKQKSELKRGEALPSLPAVPVPASARSSAPAVFAGSAPGRAARVVKTPVLARGLEHSNGDVPGLANVDAHTPFVGLLPPLTTDDTVVCGAGAVLNCGYASKKGALPLNLRRSGAGIALTISDTNIWIEPGGVRFSRSVSF